MLFLVAIQGKENLVQELQFSYHYILGASTAYRRGRALCYMGYGLGFLDKACLVSTAAHDTAHAQPIYPMPLSIPCF